MTRKIKLFGDVPLWAFALLAVSSIVVVRMGAATPAADTPGRVAIKTLSTDASRVTGGDVLVEVTLPAGTAPGALKVTVSGRDVTSAFHPEAAAGVMMGL